MAEGVFKCPPKSVFCLYLVCEVRISPVLWISVSKTLSQEQRILIVCVYFETHSLREVWRAFQNKYPNSGEPIDSMITNLEKKFSLKTATMEATVNEVRTLVEKNPQTYQWCLSQCVNIGVHNIRSCLKQLKQKPYHLSRLQDCCLPISTGTKQTATWFQNFIHDKGIGVSDHVHFSSWEDTWAHNMLQFASSCQKIATRIRYIWACHGLIHFPDAQAKLLACRTT